MNSLEYMIEVMQAAHAGRKIERKLHGAADWQIVTNPMWNWTSYDYRIAPSPIAPGHNPDQLTEEQVEVKFGWRLLTDEEIGDRPGTFDIQLYTSKGWATDKVSGDVPDYTYRTLRPPGFFLPKPAPKLRPISAKDWEPYPVIWVRESHTPESVGFVTQITYNGFHFGNDSFAFWRDGQHDLEWSPDRVNWHSFMTNE